MTGVGKDTANQSSANGPAGGEHESEPPKAALEKLDALGRRSSGSRSVVRSAILANGVGDGTDPLGLA